MINSGSQQPASAVAFMLDRVTGTQFVAPPPPVPPINPLLPPMVPPGRIWFYSLIHCWRAAVSYSCPSSWIQLQYSTPLINLQAPFGFAPPGLAFPFGGLMGLGMPIGLGVPPARGIPQGRGGSSSNSPSCLQCGH